jgi:hypothetical protein
MPFERGALNKVFNTCLLYTMLSLYVLFDGLEDRSLQARIAPDEFLFSKSQDNDSVSM